MISLGQRLASIELKSGNTIKKYKGREAEFAKDLRNLTMKNQRANQDCEEFLDQIAILKEKETEKNGTHILFIKIEKIKQLCGFNDKNVSKIIALESRVEALTESESNLTASLATTLQELSESQKHASETIFQSQAIALEKEINTNQILHKQLSDLTESTNLTISDQARKISQLSHELSSERQEAAWRLDKSRSECGVLGTRIAECEAHIQLLSENAQEASRPIVRQLESVQAQHAATIRTWESLEEGWNMRYQKLEEEYSEMVARKAIFEEKIREMV